MATAAPVPTCVFCSPKDPFLLSFPTSSSNFYNLVFPLLLSPFWLLLLQRMNGCAAENCLTQHTATQDEKGKPNKKPKTKQKTRKQTENPNKAGKQTNKRKQNPSKKQTAENRSLTHFPFTAHSYNSLNFSI